MNERTTMDLRTFQKNFFGFAEIFLKRRKSGLMAAIKKPNKTQHFGYLHKSSSHFLTLKSIKMKRLSFFLAFFFSFSVMLTSQNSPYSLKTKWENSEIIVEGTVVEKVSFLGVDGNIYTENRVLVSKLLKGAFQDSIVSIPTVGGHLGDRWQFRSGLGILDLNIGDEGVFFMNRKAPNSDFGNAPIDYEIVGERAGFYKYGKKGVYSLDDSYNGINHLYKELNIGYDPIAFLNEKRTASLDGDCIQYHFDFNTIDVQENGSNNISADLHASYENGEKRLYKGEFYLKYDAAWFGTFMVANELFSIDLEQGFESKYTLSFEDHDSTTLRLSISANSSDYSQLLAISNEKLYLGRVYLNIVSIGGDEPIYPDYGQPEIYNSYLDEEGEEYEFECIKVVGGTNACETMQITSINTEVAAGVGDVSENGVSGILTIEGSGFLHPDIVVDVNGYPVDPPPCVVPEHHRVYFTKVQDPDGDADDWIAPLEGDYLEYSATRIRVRVPSYFGFNEDGQRIEGQYAIAGSGKIGVCIDMDKDGKYMETNFWGNYKDDCTQDKSGLKVLFSTRNTTQTVGGCEKAKQVKLVDHVDDGMPFWINPTVSTIQNNLKIAMDKWRCATLVNFELKDPGDPTPWLYPCRIDGVGSGSTFTDVQINTCNTSQYDIVNSIGININLTAYNAQSSSTKMNILLHEIGHAHLLGHVNSNQQLTFPSTTNVDEITPNDKTGGEHISALSSAISSDCGYDQMILLDPSDCTSSMTILKNAENLNISPNPTTGLIYLPSDLRNSNIQILNGTGIRILSRNIDKGILDVSNLKPGVYFGIIDNNNKVFRFKFVRI